MSKELKRAKLNFLLPLKIQQWRAIRVKGFMRQAYYHSGSEYSLIIEKYGI
jgi:hypothetical protein